MQLDTILNDIANQPQLSVDLAEVALLLATDEYPYLDPQDYLNLIEIWASELIDQYDLAECDPINDPMVPLQCLIEFFFSELQFMGNQADYYNPANSYLNEVIDTRMGIPITLSILMIALGQRLGLQIGGLSFPGHFVVGVHHGEAMIVVDPFNEGQILDFEECRTIFEMHQAEPFQPQTHLHFASTRTILLRLLNNLKIIYAKSKQYEKILRVVRRQRQLKPDDMIYLREEGLAAVEAQKFSAAVAPLQLYLQKNPSKEDDLQVRKALELARREVAKWN
ncbi:MAG: tetratricopeptide repeat protein [Gemmataceae bacterium]|jgi:regulator of sirC expression with transglutaminase-like and TPR domain|nr:tetratricopeptide repeat protein [Gemmataceae bacterium]